MRKISILIVSLLATCLLPTWTQAQQLEKYMKQAAQENPQLQALFYDYYAALEKIPQATSLPDPQLMIGYYIAPVRSKAGDFHFNTSISQQFPWFGLLKVRKDAEAKRAVTKFKAFESQRNRLFFQVKRGWYELYEIEKRIAFNQQNLELLQQMEKLALKKYEAGNSQMVDILKVQMQLKVLKNQLQKLNRERESLLAQFNELLNREADEAVEIPEDMELAKADHLINLDSVLIRNPEVEQVDARLQAAEKQLKLAKLSSYPKLNVGLNYTAVQENETTDRTMAFAGRDVIQPFIGLNIPLYRKKYNAQKQEAGFRLQEIHQDKKALQNKLTTAYITYQNEWENALEDIALYQELVFQSKQALNLLIRSFSTDGRDFEEVLRMQSQLLEYETALISAQVQHNISLSKLEMLSASI